MLGKVPSVVFRTRVRDESVGGDNPYRWQDVTSNEYFSGKKVVLFSLPGAFTPTCSSTHLPGFEAGYRRLQELGIDDVYCLSVNDSFVMNAWFDHMGVENVKAIPDGSGEFTRKMGFLVEKDNLGFGVRSWRYAMIVNDGVIEKMFVEPGKSDDCETDPYGETSPETVREYLREVAGN